MQELRNSLGELISVEALVRLGGHTLRIVALLLATWLVLRIARRALPRILRAIGRRMTARVDESEIERTKRAETLGGIILSIVIVAVWTVSILMVLRELGFDIAPVLAGAGVVGLAVGFGAQNLVRDVISGAFMLLENRVRVGDVAVVNGTGGLVEHMNLRTITLRGLDGTVHMFPNGAITTLSNMTHEYSYYVFDVGVAYKEDVDRVMDVLTELGAEMQADEAFAGDILAPMEILGVDAFQDSAVLIKARIKTLPSRQWAVGRQMNRRIKRRFDELGIEIPFPHRTLYFGEASPPLSVLTSQPPARQDKARSNGGVAEA